MGRWGRADFEQLKKLEEHLKKLEQSDFDAFCESCAKALAAQLLRLVIQKTPVGDYSVEQEYTAKRDSRYHKKGDVYTKKVNLSGKQGGTLRRGWTAETHGEAAGGEGEPTGSQIQQYMKSLQVQHSGDKLIVEIINPVEYASYVEYGHRTANHKGWVPGRFMLTKSEMELEKSAPGALERKLERFLKEHLL